MKELKRRNRTFQSSRGTSEGEGRDLSFERALDSAGGAWTASGVCVFQGHTLNR